MNICIVTSAKFPPEEGIGNYVYNLSKSLIDKKHSVTILTRSHTARTTRTIMNGIQVYSIAFFPVYPFHVHLQGMVMNSIIKKIGSKFDIIHYHTPLVPVVRHDAPVVTTVHSPLKFNVKNEPFNIPIILQSMVSYRLENRLFKGSDIITSVAPHVSQELEEYGLRTADTVVVGNGVDDQLFVPARKDGGERYILFVGRLELAKGIMDFIACANILCSKDPDIRFKIVGKGTALAQVEAEIARSRYRDRFELVGPISHEHKNSLVKLYQNAAIFMLPSYYEGLPTTLLEAMACGIPIVATDITAARGIVEHGENGLVVPVKSPEHLAAAALYLLADTGVMARIGDRARKTIESRYSWSAITDKILDCYGSVVETGIGKVA